MREISRDTRAEVETNRHWRWTVHYSYGADQTSQSCRSFGKVIMRSLIIILQYLYLAFLVIKICQPPIFPVALAQNPEGQTGGLSKIFNGIGWVML